MLQNLNGYPVLIKSELRMWLIYYNDALKKQNDETVTKDSQTGDNTLIKSPDGLRRNHVSFTAQPVGL